MSAADHLQQQLFDPANTRGVLPGERSMDQWQEHHGDAVQYHGSLRQDWDNAPTAHMGSMGQAQTALNISHNRLTKEPYSRAGYFGTAAPPSEATGRVYSRRLETPLPGRAYSDKTANAADVMHRAGVEPFESIPNSLLNSAGQEIGKHWGRQDAYSRAYATPASKNAAGLLDQGKTIKYNNPHEGSNFLDPEQKPSYVVPRGKSRSWESDVLNPGSGAGGTKRDFAQQRIAKGQEGAVPFPSSSVHLQGDQQFFAQLPSGEIGTGYERGKPVRPNLNSLQFKADT